MPPLVMLKACENLINNLLGVLSARVVRCNHHLVRASEGGLCHKRPLRDITVTSAAKDNDELPL